MPRSSRHSFIGRHSAVDDLVQSVLGGTSQIVTGPPGVGTSRLLAQTAALVRRDRPVHELVATRALASMPLGVFLPVVDRVETTFEAATRVRLALTASPRLVVVDDAHLVDAASAGLLLELARGGVPLLLGVKEGFVVDEAIESIERDHADRRIVLPPLSETEVARLIRMRLDAAPDPGLVALVYRWSTGLPLYVEQILDSLIDSHRIGYESGTAYVNGGAAPIRRGVAVSACRRLSAEGLRVARLVALAGSLPESVARGIATVPAVADAEIAGLISIRPHPAGAVLEPRHPWLTESLVADLPVSVRLDLLRQLVDAHPNPPADALRAARMLIWKEELGRGAGIQELLEVVQRVQSASTATADTLLDIALTRSASPEDRLELAAMLAHQHRVGDAEALLVDLEGADLPIGLRRRRDIVHAFVLFFPGNEPIRAAELLRRHVDDGPLVRAHLATASMQSGDIHAAIRIGTSVVNDETAPAIARAHAALTLSAALVYAGRIGDYDALCPLRSEIVHAAGGELPEGTESARLIDEWALIEVRESLDAAHSLAHASYERSIARQDDGMRAQHSHQLARIALERGSPAHALPFAIGAVVAGGLWSLAFRAWTSATFIEALALSGKEHEADEHLRKAARRPRSPLFDVDFERARALVAAVAGDIEGAGDRLAVAAGRAVARGQSTRGRYALDQSVRYGSDSGARALLRMRAGHDGGALARSQDIARAWLERDPAALDARARELADRGLLWRAIEVAALSTRLGGAAESPLLPALRGRCPSLRSPVVPGPSATVLTGREADLAHRAAAGQTDADIAAATGLSIRTVQTHLSNVYHKLGIRSRAELHGRLERAGDLRSRTGT
jgi:DNA-binding CsgD family transcriptional regulator